ncbi:b124 [miniopterid betaherpesvirus 1]|uniref:B124 n=1 Tax=miniopterid betaherpesvirus 1 TaxID=3070189 RepID=I3VQB9_9BETA|nr:b124 [miniopterid betaherpesvirus 1]AFK83963.1 b124 [miniopterid betaherpesvirus 1]
MHKSILESRAKAFDASVPFAEGFLPRFGEDIDKDLPQETLSEMNSMITGTAAFDPDKTKRLAGKNINKIVGYIGSVWRKR